MSAETAVLIALAAGLTVGSLVARAGERFNDRWWWMPAVACLYIGLGLAAMQFLGGAAVAS